MKKAPGRSLLRRVRALVLDVDGVLTDGGLYYGPEGEGLKRFSVKDGMGLRLLREAGIHLALITGEDSRIVQRRAEKLKIVDVFVGVEDKLAVLEKLLATRGLAPEDAAYMGDDLNDVASMKHVGLAIAPADASPEVLRAARWITKRRGGDAAVREVCDAILATR